MRHVRKKLPEDSFVTEVDDLSNRSVSDYLHALIPERAAWWGEGRLNWENKPDTEARYNRNMLRSLCDLLDVTDPDWPSNLLGLSL